MKRIQDPFFSLHQHHCCRGIALRSRQERFRAREQLEAVLSVLDVLPFEPPAPALYASLRTGLEQVGTPIGAHDMLIAAHALALGLTIVTDNEKGFTRVRDLAHENWLR
ncbi:MAG: PIN domain-containing protein [Terriglobia bacterium]